MDFLTRLGNRAKELVSGLLHWPVIAYIVAVGASHTFYWSTFMLVQEGSKEWVQERRPLDKMQEDLCFASTNEEACHRLLEQSIVAEERAHHHFKIMKSYQIHYFAQLTTAYWTGTLAASLLFLIAKKGWDNVDDKIKGLFIGLSTTAAFFGGFPQVVQAGQNVQDNKKAYLAYENLTIEVRSYVSVEGTIETEPASFVHEVDKRLQELNNVYFDLDESKVDVGRNRLLESTSSAAED